MTTSLINLFFKINSESTGKQLHKNHRFNSIQSNSHFYRKKNNINIDKGDNLTGTGCIVYVHCCHSCLH